jgi:outer membrane protein assembly factor BamA
MMKRCGAAGMALLLLCSIPFAAQKKTAPRAIRFQGAPQYSQQELLAAAGLKADARVNPREVKARAKQLSDTGYFAEVRSSSDSKGLLFTLKPASELFPMHLENVPLTPGKELDAKLHERFALYRGTLPNGGSIVDGICRTLEEMLAAKKVKATVKATLTSDLGPKRITAMSFAVVSLAVHICRIELTGVSAAMQGKASLAANGQTGHDFDTENTAVGLERAFKELYQDQGYAAVQVDVGQGDALVAGQSIEIPYTVTIKEGGIYKIGSIDLPAGGLVARADVEKTVSKYPANSGRPFDLFILAVRDAYHAKGYLDCAVVSHPSFNEASRIVNYALEIAPGAQYRMGTVKFDGAPDSMAAKLRQAWKMAPGDVFDESYISGFAAQAQKKDKAMTKWLQTVITSYDVKADPATHEVDCIFHFAKADQAPH